MKTRDKLDLYWDSIVGDLSPRTTKKNKGTAFAVLAVIGLCVVCGLFLWQSGGFIKKQLLFKKHSLSSYNMRWDLSKYFYSDTHDVQIYSDMRAVDAKIATFVKKYSSVIGSRGSPSMIAESIIDFETISRLMYKITSYASLLKYSDANNEEYKSFYSQVKQKSSEWALSLNPYEVYLSKIGDQKAKLLMDDKRMKTYKQFIHDSRKYKNHNMQSIEMENFATEKAFALDSAVKSLYNRKISSLEVLVDGNKIHFNEALKIMNYDKKEEKRRSAYEGIKDALKNNQDDIVFVYNAIIGSGNVSNKYRKYKFPHEHRNLANNISEASLSAMVEAIESSYANTSHRYFKIKSKMLGKPTLDYWDRNVSLKFDLSNMEFSFEKSKEVILETFESFHPKFHKIAQSFFDENLIDVLPRNGKFHGAFCSVYYPMISLNFQSDLQSLKTLAHEMGHGIQNHLTAEKYPFLSATNVPLVLVEIPSIFSEMLVSERLSNLKETKEFRIAYLSSVIDNYFNEIIRAISMFNFEQKLYQKRLLGEMSNKDIQELWVQELRKSLGEHVNIADDNNFWMYISHLIEAPFYVYSYSYSSLISIALFQRYKQNKELFAESYMSFVQNIGSDTPENLLIKYFDINPAKIETWKLGMNHIAELIDELESLCTTP